MSNRLTGKRVLAIGCGQGFGATSALRMSEAGATVAVADIDLDKAQQVVHQIRAAHGTASAHWVDIGDESAIGTFVDQAAQAMGGIDSIFQNAAAVGIPETFIDSIKPIMDIDTDVWDTTMRVNARGSWLVCKYALEHLLAADGGSIVFTGSLARTATMPASGAYSVSKSAVNTLGRVIATQYGKQGIRCNTINPGFIQSRHLPQGYGETVMLPHMLTTRVGQHDDIAMLVVYLLSDESGYVTAQSFDVDGGYMSHAPTWARMSSPDSPKNRVAPDGSLH
jgi:NAD(P)-dependent dehydrogenase (short-subunit alcohol dehydrogenase family)